MHGTIFGQNPSYIRDLLVPISEMQGRTRLRSAALDSMTFLSPEHSSVVVLCRWLSLRSGTVFQSISDIFPTLENLKERF